MRSRHMARGLPLILATLLATGCESIAIPFIDKPSDNPPPPAARSDREEAAPLSRDEKIARGLSEELGWFPSLEQPLDLLEAQYAAAQSPAERNRTLSSIAYLHDTRLFVLFQDMLDFLHPDARIRELKEQNEWLDKRELLTTQAFLRYPDETDGKIAAGQAFIDATRTRIEEIEARRKLVVIK